jgi:hypothetical protein
MVAAGVTHTGQPGPWISLSSGGSSWSRPQRTMAWVWPPHTSIRVQGRVVVAVSSAASEATVGSGPEAFSYRTAEVAWLKDGKVAERRAYSDDTEAINNFFSQFS